MGHCYVHFAFVFTLTIVSQYGAGGNLSHGHRLIKLQKKVIRCIAQSKYNSHTSPLFKNIGVLKMVDVYKMACLKLFDKFKHDNVPDYFLQMFSSRDNLRPKRIVRVPQRLITDDIIVQNDLFRIEVTHTNLMYSSLCIRHVIPKLLQETYLPIMVLDKINTHSFHGFVNYANERLIKNYECVCYFQTAIHMQQA